MVITVNHKRAALAFLTDWSEWASRVAGLPSNLNTLRVEGVEGEYYNRHGLCAATDYWRPDGGECLLVQEYLYSTFAGVPFPFGWDANYGPDSGANCKERRDWVKARIAQLHAELAPKVYARAVIVDLDTIGAYTEMKDYECLEPQTLGDFDIIDDDGKRVSCWWGLDDPDCRFEKIIVATW